MSGWTLTAGALWMLGAAAPQDTGETVDTILADYEKANQEFSQRVLEIQDQTAQIKAHLESAPRPEAYAARLWPLVDADPGGEGAVKALLWILGEQVPATERERALDTWLAHNAQSKRILETIDGIPPSLETWKFLDALRESAEDHELAGRATYALADCLGFLQEVAQMGGAITGMFPEEVREQMSAMFTEFIGERTLEWARTTDPASIDPLREELLAEVMETYADVPYRASTLGQQARLNLKALQTLGVGKVAPEIEGEDVDGIRFKLSDYRGKVVMLDFWGHW